MLRIRVLLFALLLATGLVYCLGIAGPFILDDGANLEPLLNLRGQLVPWYAVVLSNVSSNVGRPVSMFTFLLNYWAFGFNAAAFKAVNIVLHLITGAVLYAFIKELLRDSPYVKTAKNIALLVTACWLLSPLFVSTVLYVVQRMAMLSTMFVLSALLIYLKFRRGLEQGEFQWTSLLGFFLCAVLGFFSKENAALLPLFLLVIELFFCRSIENERGIYLHKRIIFFLIIFPLVVCVLLVFVKSNLFFSYEIRKFTLAQRLLTESRIVWDYVRALLLPQANEFGLFHDDIKISNGLWTPVETLPSIIGWIVVLVAIVYAHKNRYWRPMAGGVAFFLAGHAMESTIFSLELYFEHRNYLPGIGIYLAIILGGERLVQRKVFTLRLAQAFLASYLVVLFVALSQRIMIWQKYELIVYSSYQNHPDSPRATIEAASQDAQFGNFDGAIAKLERARNSNLAPTLGLNLQIAWTYCLLDKPASNDMVASMFENVMLDGSPYTQTAMGQLSGLIESKPCEHFPYRDAVKLLANRMEKFYRSGEYRKSSTKELASLSGLQMRILESLNLLGFTSGTVALSHAINDADQGGFGVDLLSAVAFIDLGRLAEAEELIRKLKDDKSMAAQMEATHLAQLETMYAAHVDKAKSNGDI